MFSSLLLLLGFVFISHCRYMKEQIIYYSDPIPRNEPAFQVALKSDAMDYFFCGGALFNPLYILTAARCVDPFRSNPHDVKVFVNITHDTWYDKRHGHQITTIIIHEQFNFNETDHDIALIKLVLALVSSPSIGFAVLPTQDASIKKGKLVRSFKFGILTKDNVKLMQTNMNIVDRKQCREKYRSIGYYVSNNLVCAYNESLRRGCDGGSGFPLVDKTNRIIGLIIYPIDCKQIRNSDFPTLFIRVSSYVAWIYNHTQKENEPSMTQTF